MGLFYHVRNRKVFKNFTHNRVPEAGEETALAMNVFPDRIVYYIDGDKASPSSVLSPGCRLKVLMIIGGG